MYGVGEISILISRSHGGVYVYVSDAGILSDIFCDSGTDGCGVYFVLVKYDTCLMMLVVMVVVEYDTHSLGWLRTRCRGQVRDQISQGWSGEGKNHCVAPSGAHHPVTRTK